MKREKLGHGNTPREPYEIEVINAGIDAISLLSVNIAKERQQPVATALDGISIVALPEDDPAAIAERWAILNSLQAQSSINPTNPR